MAVRTAGVPFEPEPMRERALKRVFLPAYLILLSVMWTPFPFGIQWVDLVFLGILIVFLTVRRTQLNHFVTGDYLILAYLVGSAVSLVHAVDATRAGVEFMTLVYLGSVYLIIGILSADRLIQEQAGRWMAWATILLSAVGIASLLAHAIGLLSPGPLAIEHRLPYLGETLRLTLYFHSPELLGSYLTVGFAFALALWGASRPGLPSTALGVGLLIILVTEVFTFSHSWVGFVAAGLIAYRPGHAGRGWMVVRKGLVIAMLALFIAMLSVSTLYVSDLTVEFQNVPPPSELVADHVAQNKEWPQVKIAATYSYLYYHLLKVLAWETFLEHPVTGVGLGNFNSVTERAYRDGRLQACRGCDPHNTILGQLAETGLVGGISMIALWAWLFVAGWRLLHSVKGTSTEWIARASLAGLVGLFVNGLYTDIMHFRFLWVGIALLRGLERSSQWASGTESRFDSVASGVIGGSPASSGV